jgi:superfamily II DNA or RNA helicase
MIIEVTNMLCRLLGASDEETAWLHQYLSFETTSYSAGTKRVTMLKHNGSFPGGLLALVRDAASRDGVKIEELDKRISAIKPDANADLAWLRDYQLEAVEACVRERRGIVRSPTGSGKGEMIVGLVKRLPGRWLFLVHRETLIDQQGKKYKLRTGKQANVLSRTSPAEWKLEPGLNMMTLQSLASGIRHDKDGVDAALKKLDGLVVDECHVAPADVYYNAIERCPAGYRFGFSGTPLDRTDNRSLMAIAALGKVIYSIKAKTLIEAGVLAMPHITMIKVTQRPPEMASRSGFTSPWRRKAEGSKRFKEVYDAMIVDGAERNKAIIELAMSVAKPCMVFVKLVDHGKMLHRSFEMAGLNSEFVWGNTKAETRLAAIERLERRDSDVMVASVVFQEGVDIPSLQSVIIASGGKSVIATLQRIGRGMRTDNGRKASFEVYDILDRGSPMLERHSRTRMNAYVREGYETVIRSDDGSRTTAFKPKLKTRREAREGML